MICFIDFIGLSFNDIFFELIRKLWRGLLKTTFSNRIFILFSFLLLTNCANIKKANQKQMTSKIENNTVESDLKVHKKEFDNGLKVLVVENNKLPIMSYYTFYNIGGRHEGPGTTGATHFLEHMMFKGAKKYGPGQFDSFIEGVGGSTNAYTNFDNTVYYQNLSSVELERVIDMEADRMSNLLLEPKAFESERKVVFEERKMRYENSPRGQLFLATMKAIFEGTPYGGSVIGEEKDLASLTREQVWDFFKKFYTPDNAIIVIVGDVKADHVFQLVEKSFGGMKPSTKEDKKYKESKNDKAIYTHRGRYNRSIKLHGESPYPMFSLSFPGKPITEKEAFVMDILSSILGDGQSSYLVQKFVKGKRPILSSVSAFNYTLKYNGIFSVSGELLPRVSLAKTKSKIMRALKKSCDEAVTERNLQKTKNQYMIDYYGNFETNAGLAHFLGLRETYFDDYAFYKKEIDLYQNITVEQVKEACDNLFNKQSKSIFLSVWKKHPKK